jgi:hypothetical protein
MQWALQKPIARTYLENQRMNNRVTAQGYTAWDNVFSGNGYNLRLWLGGFKSRLREALVAQVRAIVAREGMSAMSGIVSLAIVFATITVVAVHNVGDTVAADRAGDDVAAADRDDLRTASARQPAGTISSPSGRASAASPPICCRSRRRHSTTASSSTGWCCAKARTPTWCRRSVRCAAHRAGAADRPHQCPRRQRRRQILAAGEPQDRDAARAFYWPASDRLAFKFAGDVDAGRRRGAMTTIRCRGRGTMDKKLGFSTGERQLKSLEEIVNSTDARVYLLDEWDANLDAANKAKADALVDSLAARARVVEISHRDRAA